MQEINVNSFFSAFRPENIKRLQKENNGKAKIKLSEHVKK